MKRAAYTAKIWHTPRAKWFKPAYAWRVEENKRPWRYGNAHSRFVARVMCEYYIRLRAFWKWFW